MATIKFEGKTIRVPMGWRALKNGETIPKTFMFFSPTRRNWQMSSGQGGDVGHKQGDSFCPYPHAVRAEAPARKVPAKPKPSKVSWTKKSPSIHPKATKADLAKLLQETVDLLNDIGAKWAKAQNTINTLKKKAAK